MRRDDRIQPSPSRPAGSAAHPAGRGRGGPGGESPAGGGGRVLLFRGRDEPRPDAVVATVEEAVASGQVVSIRYVDRTGEWSIREVEPSGFLRGVEGWYLVGWCRLRGAGRAFRLDRITAAWTTGERAAPPAIRDVVPDVPAGCAAGADR